ncbi:MAG: PsiF family protein [Rugosibacter sp.]
MNKRMLIILAALFATHAAWAETAPAAAGDCANKAVSKTGKPLYGAAKAASIKKCEGANKTAVAAPDKGSQQSKMATCNKEATGKKGAERKAFMKECLAK